MSGKLSRSSSSSASAMSGSIMSSAKSPGKALSNVASNPNATSAASGAGGGRQERQTNFKACLRLNLVQLNVQPQYNKCVSGGHPCPSPTAKRVVW